MAKVQRRKRATPEPTDAPVSMPTQDPLFVGESPVLVVTSQGRAQARIPFENRGEETVRARNLLPKARQLRGIADPIFDAMRLGGRIRGGQRGDLRLSITLPPTTPAGRYESSVQVGERLVPVTVVIPEECRVMLTPNRLHIEGEPGSVHKKLVVVENQGNVPISLPAPSAVQLEPHERLHAMLRRALQASTGERYEDFLQTLVTEAKEVVTPKQSRFIHVKLLEAPPVLLPGQSTVLTLQMRIPQGVARGEQYDARVTIAGVSLRLDVTRSRDMDTSEKAIQSEEEASEVFVKKG